MRVGCRSHEGTSPIVRTEVPWMSAFDVNVMPHALRLSRDRKARKGAKGMESLERGKGRRETRSREQQDSRKGLRSICCAAGSAK